MRICRDRASRVPRLGSIAIHARTVATRWSGRDSRITKREASAARAWRASPPESSAVLLTYLNLNCTVTVITTGTGTPFNSVGEYSH